MQQSIEAMRGVFAASADVHRAQFDVAQFGGSPNNSAIQNDLRVLRHWDAVLREPAA